MFFVLLIEIILLGEMIFLLGRIIILLDVIDLLIIFMLFFFILSVGLNLELWVLIKLVIKLVGERGGR